MIARGTALLILLVLAPAALAQGMPRIGYLLLPALSESPSLERRAFLEGLRQHGYVPGKTIDIVYRSAQGEEVFLGDMCQELLAEKVQLIAVSGGISVLAAKKCTSTVPVVMQAIGDPVGIGAVKSLARPEGNLTGVSFISSELAPKRVELVRELIPSARTIAVLWNARNANAREETKATLDAAGRLGLKAASFAVSSGAELRQALGQIAAQKPDFLYITFDGGLVADHRTALAQFGRERRIPIISGWSFLTEAGGLISYAPDIPGMFRRSASYVARILKGAKPADLPVEQATTVELVINQRTAKALGIAIPPRILVRADRVIE